MRSTQDKMDLLFHAYSRNWLRSLKRTRPSTSLGIFITGMFIFLWSSDLTFQLGYHPGRGLGGLVFVAILLSLAVVVTLINSLLARTGIERRVRLGLWLAAVVGPYLGLSTYARWQNPTLSHLIAFGSAVVAFWLSFLLDRLLADRSNHDHPPSPGPGS